jgi:hypothetical protein
MTAPIVWVAPRMVHTRIGPNCSTWNCALLKRLDGEDYATA